MKELEILAGQSIREALGIKKRRKPKNTKINRHERKLIKIRLRNRLRIWRNCPNKYENMAFVPPGLYREPIYLRNGVQLRSFHEKE